MNDTLTFDLRRDSSSVTDHSYASLYGALTSTLVSSRYSHSTVPAKLLGSILLGSTIAPGAAIDFQQPSAIQREACEIAAPVTVPQKIESIRDAFGLSTSALAEILQVSRPTIYQWIKGQSERLSLENRARLDRVALLAAEWRNAFPSMDMDHWLTDNEPGSPSLMDLLKAEKSDDSRIDALLSRRISDAKRTEATIRAERQASADFGLAPKENHVPEGVQRWSTARSEFLRSSNSQG